MIGQIDDWTNIDAYPMDKTNEIEQIEIGQKGEYHRCNIIVWQSFFDQRVAIPKRQNSNSGPILQMDRMQFQIKKHDLATTMANGKPSFNDSLKRKIL